MTLQYPLAGLFLYNIIKYHAHPKTVATLQYPLAGLFLYNWNYAPNTGDFFKLAVPSSGPIPLQLEVWQHG